jgi:ribosomal protein L4
MAQTRRNGILRTSRQKEVAMAQAQRVQTGDLIVVHGHRVGEPRRTGELLEVLGPAEHEHYRVRWDDGHEALFYPGGDAVIERAQRAQDEPVLVHEP